MSSRALIADVVGAAVEVASERAFSERVVALLADEVGFDVAFIGMVKPPLREPFLHNVSASAWQAFVEVPAIGAELAPLAVAAGRAGGVVVDREVFSRDARGRMAFYDHCMRPNGSRTFAAVHLAVAGEEVAVLHLGRTSTHQTSFARRQLEILRELHAPLALGYARFARSAGAAPLVGDEELAELSPREREITEMVALGYTNREIALARGASPNTVRNQLARVFEKVGVSNRAELAARAARSRAR